TGRLLSAERLPRDPEPESESVQPCRHADHEVVRFGPPNGGRRRATRAEDLSHLWCGGARGIVVPARLHRLPCDSERLPRRRPRVAWTGLTATGALLFLVPRELRIPAAVDVLPSQNADVRSAVEGIIEKVYVDEGNSVRAGDVIARLSDWDTRTELEKTKADIRDARAKPALLEAAPNRRV